MAIKNKSPLRYPGGKTRAIPILETYLFTHYPGRKQVVSPFFGGGSFELYLSTKGYTIYGNDLFAPLYIFWSTLKTSVKEVEAAVRTMMPITKEKFQTLRTTILELVDPVLIAASYYCVNRCSFSGATFCGGFSKEASTGRLNDSSLKTLASVNLDTVNFTNLDAIDFLDLHPESDQTVVYADPPYYISTYIYGKDGDMHEGFNHAKFAEAIKKRKDWVLCYNDCPQIRELYKDCLIESVSWSYGMNAKKKSSEIIILPKLKPPTTLTS